MGTQFASSKCDCAWLDRRADHEQKEQPRRSNELPYAFNAAGKLCTSRTVAAMTDSLPTRYPWFISGSRVGALPGNLRRDRSAASRDPCRRSHATTIASGRHGGPADQIGRRCNVDRAGSPGRYVTPTALEFCVCALAGLTTRPLGATALLEDTSPARFPTLLAPKFERGQSHVRMGAYLMPVHW